DKRPGHGEQNGGGRDDGEEQIERQGGRKKGNVVLVGRFQGAAHDAGRRPVPAALGLHATGSSSSSTPPAPRRATRRRRLASVSRRASAARGVGAPSSSSSGSP